MKKKVFSLMMMLLLAVTGYVRAQELTVHDGTSTSSYVPFYGLWVDDYTRSEMIYPAEELSTMAGADISSLTFYKNSSNTNSWGAASFQVYLAEVAETTLSNYIGMTGATVVYEGGIDAAGGEIELTIDFTTPYHYNGGNLLVGIYETATGSYSSAYWYGESVTGASASGYNSSDPANATFYQRNFLPKTTFAYSGGGGGGGAVDQLHVKYMDGEEEIIDELNMGVRPIGAWMEPFTFTMYTEGRTYTVTFLDFTPDHDLFSVEGEELPFQVVRNEDVTLMAFANGTQAGLIERQFVAITEGDRAAHVWPITVDLYAPETPDVWELACDVTSFPFVEVSSTAHNTTLHNDYTLPFPEIEEGVDAVYKLVFTEDQMLNAYVSAGENGKVALYREGFEGEGGPMATNYYTGEISGGGGAAGAPFEVQIGQGTSTTGYFPFYTLYNYSIAENLFLAPELEEAGVTTAPMASLSWYATNAPGYAQQGISIWMANVDDAALTTTSHPVTGMTLVYTGAMTPAVGWNEFVFNEGSFAWDGHSNILIYCQRNNGSWNSTVNWQATASMPFNAMSYRYQDSEAYDATIANPMYTSTTRPNIIMKSVGRSRDEVLFSDNFEGGSLSNWTLVDADGDGDNWQIATPATYGIGDAHSGTYCASSWSWNSYTMYPDQYMISPLVNGATSLTYYVATNTAYPDHYAVMASTTGTNTSDFVTVYEEDAYRGGNNGGTRSSMTQAGTREMSTWAAKNITLPTGTKYVAFRHYDSDDMNYLFIDDVTIYGNGGTNPPTPPTPPTPGTGIEYSAGPVIENLPVLPGTYYLVASSTTPDFEVTINAEDMPCPPVEDFAFNPIPADNEDGIEPASVTLSWSIPPYATGWRLIFGTTYYPDPNHPQTIMYPEDGSFTNSMANSYTVRNLWNNKNYFWRVEFNNDGCPEGVSSPVWGFTTHLNVPQNLTAVDETVFNDETIVLNWSAVADRTYRQYNVYRDGELIGHTTMNNISNTTYTDGPLAYNMGGYTYYVTAVYDEGESAPSNTVNVKVSGRGNVDGTVFEQDGATGIAGATVTMVGQDEFGVSHTYNFQTNAQGYYSGAVYAGSYNGSAAKEGYQGAVEPVQGNPIAIVYNETTSPVDYMMDENFEGVCTVIAQYYPDSLDPLAPYVKVYWGCGLPGEEIIEPFETGDFSLFDWQVDPTYPWSITTNNPYEGTYCMKSGGAGVANVVSNMTVTVNIPADGKMSFFGKISCESNWDYGYFYIDGQQMGSYTGAGSWGEKKFDITAGDHTFQWRYTKDGSVNSNDDCFYVDYITFYKRPEPAGPGWHTYLESDFDNAYRSNVGQCEWGYEYPTSVLAQYAGFNLTKVAVFSDAMYNAVGGNFTCNVYQGGSTPAAGTLVASITVDVPVGLDQWCEYDLNNAVNVTGSEPIYVLWTANNTGTSLGYPAGCASHSSQYGDWWNPGDGSGWSHMGDCTWTMKNYFTNRSGRTVVLGSAEVAHAPMAEVQGARMDSHLRTFAKGETMTEAECINPKAQIVPMASNNTRAFAYYRIYRTDCYNDGPYTLDNTLLLASEVTDTVYIDVDWPDALPGVYKWGVSCVYSGNRGEIYETPITWGNSMAINNGEATRDELTNDFESGLNGWTVVDANNDGYTWCLTSAIPTTWTYYASLTLDWYHGGSNAICSGSYINGLGAVTPDEYLISPQVNLGAGSQISFWVAATDASYPADHFGVFVSNTGTNPSDFQSVQEWTLTGKKQGLMGGAASRNGEGLRLGTWYNYTVDLSAYAGAAYIAFRHFNCYDQYIMCLDDITITTSGGPTPPTPPTPGTGGTQTVTFENGQIPTGWTNDATYPWVVATPAYPGYNGTYCMMSGNGGVASSTSAMEATVTFVQNGSISFLGGCWGEGSSTIYDKCQFFIDGNEQFSYGALQSWNTYTFDVTAGTHTFRWSYTKDSSVNPTGDAFFVDDITFDGVAGGAGGGLQEERESEIVWSNCLEKGMYLGEGDVDITVLLNSADSPEGVTVTFTNYSEVEQELYPVAPVVLDETGYYAWDQFRKGNYQLTIELDGYYTITDSLGIWDPTSLRYVMTEIIYGINDLYVSRTGWAMWEGEGPVGPGPGPGPQPGGDNSFEFGFENGFEGWTTIDNDGNGMTWVNSMNSTSASGYDYTGLAHGGNYFVYSQSYIDYQGAYEADNYLVTPQKYAITNGSTLTFWADNANDSYPDHFAIAIATVDNPTASDFVDVWSHQGAKGEGRAATRHDGARYQNWRSHSVDLSAYAGQNVWIAFHHQDYDEYEIWIDDVALTPGAKSDRHLEFYKVMCTSIDGEPIYNENTVYPFCQLNTTSLVEGEHYICKVAAVYSTGMSDWTEAEWEYESCENYAGTANGLTIEGTTVSWDYPGVTPGPGPGGQGSTFNVDFEGGMPTGWTVVDANNDGWTWCLTSAIPTTWTYYASLTLDWYHGGTNAICSGSYINGVGALNPDEYLISPQVELANGSQLSFWVAATDASYAADHFGVFVSTTGTNPSDFQSVQEWTLTGKKQGLMGGTASRDGNGLRLGTWYNYTVDLSAYAGQAYIAFRHFNCYDQYIMCLDDIALTDGAKGNRNPWDLMMTFTAPEGGHYGVAYDGNNFYTSNWGYSSAAHNFYKYDLSGNMLEGFEISGCGTLRGITYDGQYFYGVANSSTVYCVDLANHSVVSTFNSAYGAMRGITYDPVRDGFWVIGNWSGNLTLIDRTGAIVQTGPAPESASDLAYYKDENDVEHVYCFNNGTNDVVDWVIGNNTMGGSVFNFSNVPGFDGGSSGGCTVGSFNGKIAFIGDIQQSPNLVGIYELRDDNVGPTPPPTPSGDILGAMIFVDGEWEAFVPAPTNSYTYEGDGNDVCVRIVYNGAAELPSNNYYYAMSCEECEQFEPVGPGTCEPGAPIHADQNQTTDEVKIWWGEQPAAPISEWLYYDDGVYGTSIGVGGGVIYWASMFPAASIAPYAGTNLTKVALYENSYNTDVVTVSIYLGGSTAPGTLVSTMNYNPVGGEAFNEVALTTPVAIDGTQNLWIVFSENGTYPANACVDTGDPNNRWVSLDGNDWMDVASAGVPGYGWMIRGYVTNEGKGGMVENIAIEPAPATPVTGNMTLSHTEVVSKPADVSFMNRASIVMYNVYRSTDNVNYTMIGQVPETGATYYEYIDTPEVGTYYYQVRALYDDDCESEPAQAFDNPANNYVMVDVALGIGENSDMVALYPNPTNGNVTIEAAGMSRITVVSVLGQVVYDIDLNADNYTLNMGQFNAGLYMVRVYTESGVTVKRVTVMQ